MKRRILLGLCLVATTTIVLGQCFIDDDDTCPTSVQLNGGTCTLSSGDTIPFVRGTREGENGSDHYDQDGAAWCTYYCPGGGGGSYYPGARTDGNPC